MTVPFEISADMLYSGDPLELDAIYQGQTAYGDLPLCLSLPTFLRHGALRSETPVEAMRQIVKLCMLQASPRIDYLRRQGRPFTEYSIVCSDPTAEKPLFNSNRLAAPIGGMRFKFLDTRIGRESYVYNACEQSHHEWMSDYDRARELVVSLGLLHGPHDRGTYCAALDFVEPVFAARKAEADNTTSDPEAEAAEKKTFPWFRSLRELGETLGDQTAYTACCPKARIDLFKDGRPAAAVTRYLGNVPALNVAAPRGQDKPPESVHAIDAMSLFKEKQLVHVTAPDGPAPGIGANIVSLLAHQVYNAGRIATERGERVKRVIFFIGDAQQMPPSFIDLLDDAHRFGITFVLMYRDRQQFANVGGKDLRARVDGATAWSIDFDASSRDMIQWIQDHSPTAMRIHRSWSRPVDSIDDADDADDADADEYGLPKAEETNERFSFIEHEGPIYSRGEILELHATGRVAWLRTRINGALRITGVVPFFWQSLTTEAQYRVLEEAPYPAPSPFTIPVKKGPGAGAPDRVDLTSPVIAKPSKGK